MKKILSIALIALLATSAAFAGLSGNAKINLGANFDTGAWGFTNSTELAKLTLTWQSEEAGKVNEGDIYAGIAASFKITSETAKQPKFDEAVALKIKGSISEAYVTDGNWKVSILGAAGATDYAKSAIDKVGNNAVTFKAAAAAAPGFKATVNGYTAAFGAAGNWKDESIDWSAYVETPSMDLAEGVTAQFALAASDNIEVAPSAKFAYEGEFSASVAADLGWSVRAKAVDFDIAAKAVVAPVTFNAYYNHGKELLSVSAAATIEAVELTATAKDLLNAKDLSLKAVTTIDAVKLTAEGGYGIDAKAWKASVAAEYTADFYTAKGKVSVADNADTLKVEASISTDKLVSGATLATEYKSGNLLAEGYGSLNTSCTIKF